MKPNMSFLAGALLLALLLSLSQAARCEEQTPAEFIKEFYTWYIGASGEGIDPIKNEEIHKYVDPVTIEYLKKDIHRQDYFFNADGIPLSMDGVVIKVHGVQKFINDTYVAHVTIDSSRARGRTHTDIAIVVVEKVDGRFRIVKCLDIHPVS